MIRSFNNRNSKTTKQNNLEANKDLLETHTGTHTMINPSKIIRYRQYEKKGGKEVEQEIIVEAPVSLTVNGEVWLTFMCTPIDLEYLAIGFLYNERVIKGFEQVASVRVCDTGDNVDVWLTHSVEKPVKWSRTSGCTGGITFIENYSDTGDIDTQFSTNGTTLDQDAVFRLLDSLFNAQNLYRKSGGVHSSILTDGNTTTIMAEDIGRHNTLDKISGRYLIEPVRLDRRIIVTTGRISSDMLLKANNLRASVVISRTSPSSLSIEMASKWGITLIGYARRNQFRVYTHPERIIKNAMLKPQVTKALFITSPDTNSD